MKSFSSAVLLPVVGLLTVINLSESLLCYQYNCVNAKCTPREITLCSSDVIYCFKSRYEFNNKSYESHNCLSESMTEIYNVSSTLCHTKIDIGIKSGGNATSTICSCVGDICNTSVRCLDDFFKIFVLVLLTLKFV